ncbi:hypothetical protein LTR53_001055 [Teratosphaeriaceae sp. CCFEE 6253]|nr:hypothetical protein LTR53_001055 [Teratosphaeriaceae sp. CCFEE 6253]
MSTQAPTGNFLLDCPRPVQTYHSEPYPRIPPSNFNGQGKSVLITGGATGIGWAISQAFAETGVARLVIVSRSPCPLEQAKEELHAGFPGVEVLTFSASMTDHARMAAILNGLEQVDVLVHCAAATHTFAPTAQIPVVEMHDTFATNVLASFALVQAYLALPPPAGGARTKTVINISSASAHLQIPTQAGYGASKAAFTRILSAFASEHTPGKDGVRMFSLHPGAFYTPMAAKQYGEDAFVWEDVRVPAYFCLWLGLGEEEPEFLHGRFVWAAWDVDELCALRGRVERIGGLLKIGLVL